MGNLLSGEGGVEEQPVPHEVAMAVLECCWSSRLLRSASALVAQTSDRAWCCNNCLPLDLIALRENERHAFLQRRLEDFWPTSDKRRATAITE